MGHPVADVNTPSGFSSNLEPSNFIAPEAIPSTFASDSSSCNPTSLLSSTVRDGATSLPDSQDVPDVSIIEPPEIFFCPKCGTLCQK